MIPEQPWSELEDLLLPNIPAAKAAAIRRLADPRSRTASLLGLLLLASARAAQGLHTRLSDLIYPSRGKPTLPDAGDFSISHGGARVACAVVSCGRIGFDVEPQGRLEPAALRRIASAPERARVDAGGWTATEVAVAKEAVVKAFGATYADLAEVILGDGEAWFRGERLHLDAVFIGAGHVATLADSLDRPPGAPRYVDPLQLLGSWRAKSIE